MVRRSVLVQCVAGVLVVSLAAASLASARETTKQILQRIEETLAQIIDLLTPAPPPPPVLLTSTRLLFPFASNEAGFDMGISISNTGRDSSGVVGSAGPCTIHYFGTKAPSAQTTNAAIPVGGHMTFTLSGGGELGIAGAPNFEGYIEAVCQFPFAHGYGFFADGPIGSAQTSAMVPALVLAPTRTKTVAESVGQ